MVGFSGFFGGGAAQQVGKERELTREEDRLELFRKQITDKASRERVVATLKTADALEEKSIKLGQAFKASGKPVPPSIQQTIDSGFRAAQAHRESVGQGGGVRSELSAGLAAAPPAPGPTAQKLAEVGAAREAAGGEPLSAEEIGRVGGAVPAPSAFQQKFDAFLSAEQERTGQPVTPEKKLEFIQKSASGFGFGITVDPETGKITLSAGQQPAATGRAAGAAPGTTPLKAGKIQPLSARIENMGAAINDIEAALKLPPGSFGVGATVKRGVRETGRVGADVAALGLPEQIAGPFRSLVGVADDLISQEIAEGTMTPREANKFRGDTLTSARGFERRLAFMYARVLQPTGKLQLAVIQDARDATKLSGLVSEKTARETLIFLRKGMVQSRQNLIESIPKTPTAEGQEAAPPAAQAAPPATQAPVFTIDDLRRLTQ